MFTRRILFAFVSFLIIRPAFAADNLAQEIALKNFSATRSKSSEYQATIKLISAVGQERVRQFSGASKISGESEDRKSYVSFLSPAEVKGTAVLTIENSAVGKDDSVWIYLPALKKVRRLVSSNKKDSFMGTDFTIGDVVGYKPRDWAPRIKSEEIIGGVKCVVLEFLPASSQVSEDTGLSRRLLWIDSASFVTVKGQSFDESGELIKEYSFTDYKLFDKGTSKWQAMTMSAENVQSHHKTVIRYDNYQVGGNIPDSKFSVNNLDRY